MVSESGLKKKELKMVDYFKFIIPSLIGILLLMFPFKYKGETTILVALLADIVNDKISFIIPTLVLIFVGITAIGTIIYRYSSIDSNKENQFLQGVFDVSMPWLLIRVLGFIFTIMVYFEVGPQWIISDNTGGLILNDLILKLFTIFMFASFLLPFLTEFGLLEYVGVLLTPIMRPLFNLPGRSSIDCVASWVGDGTIGVTLTSKQYEEGYYSKKEAAIIATTFSAVSITFCLVILGQVDLTHLFGPYYFTVILSGVVAAIVMPKIPPLAKKEDSFFNNEKKDLGEDIPSGYTKRQWALKLAVNKAENNLDAKNFIINGIKSVLDMWLGVLPAIMAFGTLGLILAENTPIFEWMGLPFIPILKILQIPYPVEVSKTIMVGFADMFLPSVIGATIPSELSRFVIATLSVTQLIYLSETGAVILGSKIDISPIDLLIIYIERTLITLPVIALVGHILF